MANDAKRTRALGALVIVAVGVLVIGRFVVRTNQGEEADGGESESVSESVGVGESGSGSASAQGGARHARYESGLVAGSVRALSSGAGTALAVGDDGGIFELRLVEAAWKKMDSPTRVTLRAVAQQVDDGVAVGDGGTILELENAIWKTVPSGTTRTLRAVAYTSYGAVAVGDGGTIVRRPAPHAAWQVEPSGTTSDLFGACAGLRDVWLVGRGGTIVGRASDAWRLHVTVGSATLYAVACDDHAAIAVGEKGAIVERLDDVDWHASANATAPDLLAIAGVFGTTSFTVVGAGGAIVHVAGDATAEAPILGFDLRAVTEGALGTWVAGERGIFRRVPM